MAFSLTKIIKGLRLSVENTTSPANIDIIPAGTAGTTTTFTTSQTADRTITSPNRSGEMVLTSGPQTLTGTTIDGDDNTLRDIALTSLKTVLADADTVITRDGAGAVVSSSTIARARIAPTTASRAVINDATGALSVSATTDTELAQLTGVTANVQTQINAINATTVPAGSLFLYAGLSAPGGYQLCYGQELSRALYPLLFAAIGTTYGVGDGSTTFNLPDLRGRTAAGKDDMGGVAANRLTAAGSGINGTNLGAGGGAETVTLDTTQIPSHTHIQDAHNHTQNAHTHTQNAHTHTQDSHNHTQIAHRHNILSGAGAITNPNIGYGFAAFNGTTGGYVDFGTVGGSGNPYVQDHTAVNIATTATNQNTTATNQNTTATNNATTATNQNTGGGLAHNNTQPSLVLNYIIKE